jgi:hypothetical protein
LRDGGRTDFGFLQEKKGNFDFYLPMSKFRDISRKSTGMFFALNIIKFGIEYRV